MNQTYDDLVKAAPPVTHTAQLTSSEIGNLWQTYVHYSMLNCIVRHMHRHVQDVDIQEILEESLDIFEDRIRLAADFLSRDGRPVPIGFPAGDVDLNAPPLFADVLPLLYKQYDKSRPQHQRHGFGHGRPAGRY